MAEPHEVEALKTDLEGYKIKELQERIEFLQGELSKKNITADWLAERIIKKVVNRSFEQSGIKDIERKVDAYSKGFITQHEIVLDKLRDIKALVIIGLSFVFILQFIAIIFSK